jgi:multisubunit Na+/H+ antiporter MnhC subunit
VVSDAGLSMSQFPWGVWLISMFLIVTGLFLFVQTLLFWIPITMMLGGMSLLVLLTAALLQQDQVPVLQAHYLDPMPPSAA